MSTTRRSFLRKSLAAAGGFMASAFLPRSSYASCASQTMSFEFNHEGVIHLPDWKLGDCELKQATLTITGNFVRLNALVGTHFTHTKDIWHMEVKLVTRDNSDPRKEIVLGTGKMDSPKLSEQDKPLFHHWNARFSFNALAATGHRIGARVTSCC